MWCRLVGFTTQRMKLYISLHQNKNKIQEESIPEMIEEEKSRDATNAVENANVMQELGEYATHDNETVAPRQSGRT